jgi:hypothetical protein
VYCLNEDDSGEKCERVGVFNVSNDKYISLNTIVWFGSALAMQRSIIFFASDPFRW